MPEKKSRQNISGRRFKVRTNQAGMAVVPICLSLHRFRKSMPTESCLDCGTPLEMTLPGQKKKPCHKCGAYRRKREYP